jgi:hypothetical protein
MPPPLPHRLRQGCAVRLSFLNCFNDVIHIPAVGQEQIPGHPDGRRTDLLAAFQLMDSDL